MKFHNPYAFIPVTGRVNGRETPKTAFADIAAGRVPFVRHDRWEPDAFSGRILCRLTTKSPLVVGGEQTAGSKNAGSGIVEPFTIAGQLAIPGNSLRGMVGNVAEALSQSALRVLEERPFSVRKAMGDSLSALGMLEKDASGWMLRPLTLPTPRSLRGQESGPFRVEKKWRQVFLASDGRDPIPLHELLWAYVDGYRKEQTRDGTRVAYNNGSFLERHRPDSTQGEEGPLYYAALRERPSWSGDFEVDLSTRGVYIKRFEREGQLKSRSLLGQRLQEILTEAEWRERGCPEGFTPGYLRALGIEGRERDMPPTKKHELFVPLPETERRRLPVPEAVIERFKALAGERAEASEDKEPSLPFVLSGSRGWQPRAGMLVFFDVDGGADGRLEVSEISISAIWRQQAGSAHAYFRRFGAQLLPWSRERYDLSPAECLFGVVQADGNDDGASRNLASRVRFHDAHPLSDVRLMPRTLLKILASPKPPSPAMYFNSPTGYVRKTALATDNADFVPNGRKRYLVHRPQDINESRWRTLAPEEQSTLNQKLSVQPIPAGASFQFHVDFENLSAEELGLLLASIEPGRTAEAARSFLHRLGLGKPLGLGHVEVETVGVFLVDRYRRYRQEALSAGRYHRWWGMEAAEWPSEMVRRYPLEAAAAADPAASAPLPLSMDFIDGETLGALLATGDQQAVSHPVCYPFATEQGEFNEQEGFKWFMENERGTNQYLGTIRDGSLPLLKSEAKASDAKGGGKGGRRDNKAKSTRQPPPDGPRGRGNVYVRLGNLRQKHSDEEVRQALAQALGERLGEMPCLDGFRGTPDKPVCFIRLSEAQLAELLAGDDERQLRVLGQKVLVRRAHDAARSQVRS